MTVNDILKTPEENRDLKWEQDFFNSLLNSKVKILNDDPQNGPDGFPYLLISTEDSGTEPVPKILDWLATRGIGLVVNPQNKFPDYIFTYGMIWNFKERNRFLEPIKNETSSNLEINPGEKMFYGDPSEDFFPKYARNLLKEFFQQQGILQPRVIAISKNEVDFDICFSLDSMSKPDPKEHQGIAQAISWFFPFNTPIVLLEEKGLPNFYSL